MPSLLETVNMHYVIGDCDPFGFYTEMTKRQLRFSDVIREEYRLTNLYLHALKDGANILRVPTALCTKGHLQKTGEYAQIESIINVCISTAKNALRQVGANCLLAGCISRIDDVEHKSETTVFEELQETIIYISDFGVDIMVIEGISDWGLFELTVGFCRKLTGSPIAPFFKTDNINIALVQEYKNLCNELGLELMGFEVFDVKGLEALCRIDITSESPLGLLVGVDEITAGDPNWSEQYAGLIRRIRPTVLLGGLGMTRKKWLEMTDLIRQPG